MVNRLRWSGWPRVKVRIPDGLRGGVNGDVVPDGTASSGQEVEAIAPLIISASRSTDIPAFYGDWFMERLRRGYAKWINPWNGAPIYVSFQDARVFVFWSKNPAPFLPRLDEMTRDGYRYYLLYTLNDYEAEGIEPRLPPLEERIQTFITLSRMAGRGRVVWRWDPLLLSETLDVTGLLDRVKNVGNAVAPFTERVIFSFIDIARYPRVAKNLRTRGFGDIREFSPAEERELAAGLQELNRSWGLTISACGEEGDFSCFGIKAGGCISRDLMLREFGEDPVLRQFLEGPDSGIHPPRGTSSPVPPHLKDPGQRPSCGCVVSKDIGEYSTCPHLCAYCYANTTPDRVEKRYAAYRIQANRGAFGDSISG
ncbi:MAG: DUF1848 domain-containing protein [Methanomicrobiales archaeon]|nr:DUF1848 domain-containing protein [Methanomicrobiales archaeon]